MTMDKSKDDQKVGDIYRHAGTGDDYPEATGEALSYLLDEYGPENIDTIFLVMDDPPHGYHACTDHHRDHIGFSIHAVQRLLDHGVRVVTVMPRYV